MGKRGPAKQYPHQLRVLMTEEQHRWLQREAALTGGSPSDVVRAAIDTARTVKAAS